MDLIENMAESVNTSKQNTQMKLNVGRTIYVGLAFFAITMFWQVYDNLMPLFLADFNLSKSVTGVIMAMDNVLALVLLPLMGMWSDNLQGRIRNRMGRRMPFIVVGSTMGAVLFLAVNFAHDRRLLAVMIAVTALLLICMCFYRTPAVALMPDVTPKQLRSQGNAVINIMGTIGGVIALVLMNVLCKYETVDGEKVIIGDNWLLFSIISLLMIATTVVMIFKVKENKFVEEKQALLASLNIDDDGDIEVNTSRKSVLASLNLSQRTSIFLILGSVFLWYMAYNGVTTFFSSFATEFLGREFTLPLLVANAAAFVCFIPASKIGKRIGRKRTILIGIAMMIIAFVGGAICVFTLPKEAVTIAMYPAFILVGGGWATINVHSFVMSVEMATESTTGVFTGLYYTFSMAAQIITPILMGLFIDLVGYQIFLPYAALFMILAMLTMSFVRHGNAKDVPIA